MPSKAPSKRRAGYSAPQRDIFYGISLNGHRTPYIQNGQEAAIAARAFSGASFGSVARHQNTVMAKPVGSRVAARASCLPSEYRTTKAVSNSRGADTVTTAYPTQPHGAKHTLKTR